MAKAIDRRSSGNSYLTMSGSKSKSPQQPVKVFIVGNPSVGKSLLAKALQTEASAETSRETSTLGALRPRAGQASWPTITTTGRRLRVVSHDVDKTAAPSIVPCQFTSKKYGPVIFYELGGQVEYYASHAALLQSSESSSTPLFIIVVNLCDSEEDIKQKLAYWISFLAKHCTSLTTKPHVIIVGSHSDIVSFRGDYRIFRVNIELLLRNQVIRSSSFQMSKFIPMDCQQPKSRDIVNLVDSIKTSCDALRKKSGVAYEVQQLFLFLQDRFKGVSAIAFEKVLNVCSVPMSVKDLHYNFRQLHDAGLITYLENADVTKSWIVLDSVALLSEVTSVIFTPPAKTFKFLVRPRPIKRSIGVVPVSSLFQRLPHHNPNMLVQLLTYLELCYKINDHEVLQLINQGHTPGEHFLFFPCLIDSYAPSGLVGWEFFPLHCGWMLQCCEACEFLTYKFLRVLLLRIAFSCTNALGLYSRMGSNCLVLQSTCLFWKNGISWNIQEGVKALVAIRNPPQNREVLVMLRCESGKEVECARLRSTIIQMVLKAKQEFCPKVTTKEFFLHPSQVRKYPFKSIAEQNLVSIKDVSEVVVEGASNMCDSYGRVIDLKKLLLVEPYTNLGVNILQQLFDRKTEVVSDSFLYTIAELIPYERDSLIKMLKVSRIQLDHLMMQNGSSSIDLMCVLQCWRGDSGTYQSLRETLDQFSVFAGRNPLVSHYCVHFATTVVQYTQLIKYVVNGTFIFR